MRRSAADALSSISIRRRDARSPVRRGHHAVGLIVTISIVVGASVAAVAFRPRDGVASQGADRIVATSPRNQRTLELLASIFGRCHQIIALHPAEGGTQTDLVLWLDDTGNPGTMDSSELGVITHSMVLQTVAFHHLDGGELEPAELATLVQRRSGRDPYRPSELTREIVMERGFPNRWRALELVRTSILARGVSDLHATIISDATRGGSLMRIELRWAPESADGADQASVLVDIGEH